MAKILVSIDDRLLKRIDAAVRKLGLSRSAYLARLAERALGTARGPGTDPRVRAALRATDKLFAENPTWGDSTELVRQMRDERGAELGRRVSGPA